MPPPHDHAVRRNRVLASISKAGAISILVTDLVNIRYLTGFTGSNASVAIHAGQTLLVTDGRYVDQAAAQSPDVTVVVNRATDITGLHSLVHAGAGPVAIESANVSVNRFDALVEADPRAILVKTTGVVESLRRSKDTGEVARLQIAGRMICEAVEALMPQIAVGMTERQVARRLEWLVLEVGAEGVAFESIVASGPNSAIPHHSPSDRAIEPGDFLKIDAGALYDGYRSDMTRTFVVGAGPTAEQQRIYDAVAAAASDARDMVGAGVDLRAPDAAARSQLAARGLETRYTHGLGHGVGLQIHEAPMLNSTATDKIVAGDVLTIEPGAYIPGFGGVRIEDTLAVDTRGSTSLTTTARELVRLG